jgi:hypothetical protein
MQALGPETEACTDKHVENIAITADPETTNVLDTHVLAQLAVIQRNGRPGFVERIITLFLQTASDLIKDLEAASANNEPVGLLPRQSYIEAMQRDSWSFVPCCSLRSTGKDGPLRFATESRGAGGGDRRRIQARRSGFEGLCLPR